MKPNNFLWLGLSGLGWLGSLFCSPGIAAQPAVADSVQSPAKVNPALDAVQQLPSKVYRYTEELGQLVLGSHGSNGSSHGDPYAPVFQSLFFLVLAAVLGRYLARKLHQPAVLGELMIGVILGAIAFSLHSELVTLIRYKDLVALIIEHGSPDLSWIENVDSVLNTAALSIEDHNNLRGILISPDFPTYYRLLQSTLLFSSLGVILLLFMVGLESSIEEMKHAGLPALVVAVLGVVIPFSLGYMTAWLLLPEDTSSNVLVFTGATLCATSIGITARVFRDLGKLQIPEAKVVLGAAVIDDVLGLIVLAVVSGIVVSGGVNLANIGLILLKAALFLGFILLFGAKWIARNIRFFSRLDQPNLRLMYPIGLLVLLSWLADAIGLATIVGAFAAGLILKEEHFNTGTQSGKSQSVERLIAPIEGIFAPVFFVLMGVQVDLTTFLRLDVLLVAIGLTFVAIAGKLLAAAFLPKHLDKLVIGAGMIPRGEVGLIFAGIGKGLGVFDGGMFSAIIILVILTTLLTPPLLKWAIERRDRRPLKRFA
jgi:Kef-type K+ transport system membrane component KefB